MCSQKKIEAWSYKIESICHGNGLSDGVLLLQAQIHSWKSDLRCTVEV